MTKTQSKIIALALLTLITVVLLISTTNVNAAAVDTKSQSISALSSVIGIKTDSYRITQNTKQDNLYGIPQEKVDSFLTSEQGSFRVTFSYTKGYLNQIYFSDIKGAVSISQPKTSYIENTKQFLNNFDKFVGDSIYNQFSAMLNNVELGKNASITTKNVDLKINSYEKESSIVWTYVDSNGIRADQKHVVFEYENGQLVAFINTWQLYRVSGTPKITTDQANLLAIEASKTFSYEATVDNKTQKVTGFSINQKSLEGGSITYSNFYEPKSARESDPFTLYPLWHIFLGFDKFYPGDVSGMDVYIWGDTGKVAGMHEFTVDSSIGYPTSTDKISQDSNSLLNQSSIFSVSVLLTILASIVLVTPIYCKRFKRARFFNGKFLAVFFTGLILLSLVLTATSQANATSKSRIYSIEHCLGNENGYGNDDADVDEAVATAEICNYVGNLTQNYGYDTTNSHGLDTTRSNVLDDITDDQVGFDETILFHAGHFAQPAGRAYQDDSGQAIFDTDIYPLTNTEHSFVFLWVCNCANNLEDPNGKVSMLEETTGLQPGLPIAWTHRDEQNGLMNFDGYTYPDYEGQCYISFRGLSPMLSGLPVRTFEALTPKNPSNCKDFVMRFYDHAITEFHSIHDALNLASYDYFGCSLSDSPLSTDPWDGYNTWWPGGEHDRVLPEYEQPGWFPSQICGDPLNQMRVHGDSSMHIYKSKTLTITTNCGGSTTPAAGVQQYIANSVVTVTASPASGKVLYNWLLDSTQNLGNALSVDITMNGPHTLSANFIDAPSPLYPYAYAPTAYSSPVDGVGSPWSLTGFQPDGYCAGLGAGAPYGIHGIIVASLNAAATGHVCVYGSATNSESVLVEVSSTGADGSWASLGSHSLGSSAQWVDCGISWSSFSYVRLTADGYDGVLSIDSVRVTPIKNYTLTVNSATGGYTNTSTNSYIETTVVNVQANASSGYYFDHWHINGTDAGTSNPLSITMNNNYVLQPVFSPVATYSLTVSTNIDNVGIGVAIDGNYYNSPVTITVTAGYHTVSAPPDMGYWYLAGFSDGYGNGESRPINSNTNIVAYYAPYW